MESLAPFTTSETMTVTFLDGSQIVISVTDEAYGHEGQQIEIESDGTFDLTKLAIIQVTTTANTTDLDWDAELPFQIRYDCFDVGVMAIKDYINVTNSLPTLVYDFSSILNNTNLDKVIPASYYLSTGYRTVGKVDITTDGKAVFTFTDREWLESRNSLRGTFDVTLVANPEKVKDDGDDSVEFPATGTPIPVTYKKIVSNSTKNLNWPIVANPDGSYTLNYTVYVDANGALDTLFFTDTMTGLQSLDASTVKVNGIPVTGLTNGQNPFYFEVGNFVPKNDSNKIPSGRYTVTYSTTITAEQMATVAEGGKTVGDNTTHWVADGEAVDPDGHAEYEITKPITPVPVDKEASATTAEPKDEITYTITFGDEHTPLANLEIVDSITDVQTVQGNITLKYGGITETITPSAQITDDQYSLGMVETFRYTFPETVTAKGPVTVTYKTKVISEEDAKKNNIFGAVNAVNNALELRTNQSDTTTTTITYPDAPVISVQKTASVPEQYKNEDGTWKPGAPVTYTIIIDSDTHDLSGLKVDDTMSFLQQVDLSNAEITVNETVTSLADYISANNGYNNSSSSGNGAYTQNLFGFTFPENTTGPVTITYTATVLTVPEAEAKGIYDSHYVNNTIIVGNTSATDGSQVDYPEQPRFPVEKTPTYTVAHSDTGAVDPGDEITYTVSYGGSADFPLDGARLYDEMTDIQKLNGNVTVTLDHALLRDITWPDGSVWHMGETTFTMPMGSSQWAEDGVVWPDYFDDGQYHLNENVRVYCLTLPNGRVEFPSNPYFADGTKITVSYKVNVISEPEALASGFTGLQNAYNKATAGNGSSITTVPVQFPPEVTHEPAIEKKWVSFDFDRNLVYWEIHVTADTANGSTYPLEYVSVYENVANNGLQWKNEKQGVNNQIVEVSDLLLTEAVVTTDSGVVLQPGEDYIIDKLGATHSLGYTEGAVHNEFSMSNQPGYPSFSFRRLDEGVTIRLAYGIKDNNIINGFWAMNTATVTSKQDAWNYYAGKEAEAVTTYTTPDIDMTKNGSSEESNPRVMKWIVRINPSMQEFSPDLTAVIFNDTLPTGLQLINYSSYISQGIVDSENPSFYVKYSGKVGGTGREFDKDGYTNYRAQHGPFNYDEGNPNPSITATVTDSAITNANIAAIYPFNSDDSIAYMSEEFYQVEYYTYVSDAEWEKITSSLTGSKTYVNTATVKMREGDLSATGTSSISIMEEDFIDKTDVTVEDADGVVINESTHANSNYIKYAIDINRNAMKLVSEENAKLTMSDRISTNMDLDTDTLKVEFWDPDANTHEGGWVNIKNVENQSGYDHINAISISYNDDSRYLIIDNIPDETHFRITYGCIVRSTGPDTFKNTAVLTGGGSHSSSTEVEHNVKPGSANIFGGTNNVTLVKIDENNISKKLPGVQFEVYECFFDEEKIAEWQYTGADGKTHFDFNKIEAAMPPYGTSPDPASLIGEMKKLYDAFQVKNVEPIGGTLTTGETGTVATPVLYEEHLYYWVETQTIDGYTAVLNDPHYFVVYQTVNDNGVILDGETDETWKGTPLQEWEVRQWRAWALDDASQFANTLRIASLSGGNQWTVNNHKIETTSISATKAWAGDYDNFYETRPVEGIQLKLWQIEDDGSKTQYGTIIPINVDKKTGEWPTYTWTNLPTEKIDDNGGIIGHYTYAVEELPVAGYTTEYSANGAAVPENGLVEGNITITNTLIPTKTNISVKKEFDQEGDAKPDQILVNLYEITNDRFGVNPPTRILKYSYPLSEENGWQHEWKNLPTKDDDGNALTYTVQEDMTGLGMYTAEYSDQGQGVNGGEIIITNHETGLEITKTFEGDVARLLADNETAAAMRQGISFTVTDGLAQDHIASFTVDDMTPNENGVYSIRLYSSTYPWIVRNASLTVTETNTVFQNTDLTSVTYSVNGGAATTVTSGLETVAVNGILVSGGVDKVSFKNTYEEEKTSLTVNKTWLDVNGDPKGWPEGVNAIVFDLTADEGSGAAPTGDSKTLKKTDDPSSVTFTDLPKYALNSDREIVYSVTESVVGYESSVTRNADGSLTVTNQKAGPRLYVKKVWSPANDAFIPGTLTIDLYEGTSVGAASGGTLVNTITISAADDWSGFFDSDSEGNPLVEGRFYYIQERGVSGWTLESYSEENGSAFRDMEIITATNKRRTPPPPVDETLDLGVQKIWTENGRPVASPEDDVKVKLVRYKTDAPTGTTVRVFRQGEDLSHAVSEDFEGIITIDIHYDNTIAWFDGEFNIQFYSDISSCTYQWEWDYDHKLGDPVKTTRGLYSINLNSAPFTGHDVIYVYIQNTDSGNALNNTSPTVSGNEPVLSQNAVWYGPDDYIYATTDPEYNTSSGELTLSAANSWQYEFQDLPKQGTDNGTKYLYRYAIQEITVPGFTTSYTYQNGEQINLSGGGTADALGTDGVVKVTNNRETVKITANKKWGGNVWPANVTKVGVKLVAKVNGADITSSLDITPALNGNAAETTIAKPASGNEASVTWSRLPKLDNSGNEIAYTIEETSVTTVNDGGTPTTYSETSTPKLSDLYEVAVTQPNASGNATITNTPIVGKITVTKEAKVDEDPDPEAASKKVWVGLFSNEEAGVAAPLDKKEITISATGSGTAEFTNLTPGTYYVYELNGENGSAVKSGSVTVEGTEYTVSYTDAGATAIEINTTKLTHTATVTNSRQGKGKLTITKTMVGASLDQLSDAQKQEITFTVTGPGNYSNTITLAQFTGGSYTIDDLPLGAYTVVETNAANNAPDGYTFVSTQYVTANQEETAAVATVAAGGTPAAVTVTNTYTKNTSYTPKVTKVLNQGESAADAGKWPSGGFDFTIAFAENGNPNNGAALGTATANAASAASPMAAFGAVTFTKAGTYIFSITEAVPEGATNKRLNGITYNDTPITLTVVVTEDTTTHELGVDSVKYSSDNTPSATSDAISAASGTIVNTYDVTPTTYAPKITKTFSGTWPDNGFGFTLAASETNGAGAAMGGKTASATESTPTATFADITFSAAGTYSFTITETVPADAMNANSETYSMAANKTGWFVKDGIAYDATPVTVQVIVADNQGALSVTSVTYNGGTVVTGDGIGTASGAVTNKVVEASGNAEGTKVLTGRDWKDEETFIFTLTPDDTTAAAITAGTAVLPTSAGGYTVDGNVITVTASKPDTGNEQTFTFPSITFKTPGTYAFTMAETAGNAKNMTYASNTVTVTFTVAVDANGDLSVTPTYSDSAAADATAARFENIYADREEIGFSVEKTLIDGGTAEKTFTFTLKQVEGDQSTTTPENAKLSGTVTTTITVSGNDPVSSNFDGTKVAFSQDDIGDYYWFLIEEDSTNPVADVKYDATLQHWIKVTVSLGDDDELVVKKYEEETEITAAPDASFTNTELTSISVTKQWPNKVSNATSISFALYQKLTAAEQTTIKRPYQAEDAEADYTGTVQYTNDAWETVTIPNLPKTVTIGEVTYNASYYVVETVETATSGYILTTAYSNDGGTNTDSDPSSVAVDSGTITIINTETAGVTLPSTGGPGTVLYTAAGLSLILGASLWLMLRRRKEQQN